MATFQKRVDAANNDAFEWGDDTNFQTNVDPIQMTSNTTLADARVGGFRFTNVTIPQGSTINSATITTVANSASQDDPDVDFYAEDVDNSADFSTTADVVGRTRTTASVSWTTTGIGTGAVASPDIGTVIQEVVNRGSWASGNALMIIVVGKTSGAANQIWRVQGHVNHPTTAALLDVDYTEPVGGDSTSPNALRINASRGNFGTNMTTR